MTALNDMVTVRRWPAALMAAGALIISASTLLAQIELGVMRGIIHDESGKPLEGVTVKLHDLQRGQETIITSGKDGRFYRRGLSAVEYEITVEKEGYRPLNDRLKLTAGLDRNFTFTLVKAAPEGAKEFAAGVAAFNNGENEAAVKAFEAAVAKAPAMPAAHVNLALAYLKLKRSADAAAELEKAATLAPEDAHVLFQLGGAYVELNALDKAASALERGLAASPDLKDPLAFEAQVTLGAVYFAKGDNDRAISAFDKALSEKPAAPAPTLGLAKAFFNKKQLDRALQLFHQVVTSAPESVEAAEARTFIRALEKQ